MKVTLVASTNEPLKAIAVGMAAMKEKDPLAHVEGLGRKELEQYVNEMFKTKLAGCLEKASMTFHIEGVTRAFTHQIVRHRVGFSFSQQSMRFFDASESGFLMPSVDKYPKGDTFQQIISETRDYVFEQYRRLLKEGCPAEEARSILPTNVLTSITVTGTYRGWKDMAEKRLCLQTQGEFRNVMRAIKKEMKKADEFLADKLVIVCQNTGHCPFKSIFDRYCPVEKSLPAVRERLKKQGLLQEG